MRSNFSYLSLKMREKHATRIYSSLHYLSFNLFLNHYRFYFSSRYFSII